MENQIATDNGKSTGRNPDGTFAPGSGGRRPGSKNKLRETIKTFVEANLEDLQNHFDQIDSPKEKIKLLIEMMPYVVPRLQGVSQVDADGNDLPREGYADMDTWAETDLRLLISLHEKYEIK